MMPVLPGNREACVCSTLRAASRHVSQLYDDALGPLGLTITSYALLGRIDILGAPSMNELADAAVMDRSTLSRNLKPLLDARLIGVKPGTDRRRKEFSLTAAGRTTLASAYPRWQDVQVKFRRAYGAGDVKTLVDLLGRALALDL
jgi:DNA-binding MarR family transcriptional regulator